MQNSSGLDTLPSPNTPVPSSVEVSACKPSYDMTSPCTLAIPEGNRLMALRTIFDSVTADPKEWPRIVFFLQYRQGLKECQEMAGQSFTGTIMRNSAALKLSKC
ncbi:hypothetical protein LUQ84_001292 [Hamiltosporidium tvaerminnensis]|nr:hypothetical protein LUQ84_001292 [Hamiltosporidium tvaerminnensis]